ncbi:DUF3152 domain-containing protein [Streptomyces sp. NPDC006368]|uniref:DUF3152 domain-containing protein n=1 Tax=Streptomyces sp. NPDC006368 TaxID=3156760 RepID=UPI0033AC0DD6
MGRHSRKGPASTAVGEGDVPAGRPAPAPGSGRRRRGAAPPPSPAAPAPGPYDTPHHGTHRMGDQQVRGGHPEHREQGGGWGQPGRHGERRGAARPGQEADANADAASAARAPRGVGAGARMPGPRREFVEAFEEAPRRPGPESPGPEPLTEDAGLGKDTQPVKPPKGRAFTFTGIAAAAVTTVLAVVVAGQVTDTGPGASAGRPAGEAAARGGEGGSASRSDERRAVPPRARQNPPAVVATYAQLMTERFPMDPELKGSGRFEAVPGLDRAPGKGRKVRYRVDVEQGLGLDAGLFADAVQKTLNDDRSWAHGGAMTFERISTGTPDFVITLASPGTTGVWCAKSGLDTTIDNVSCDSAATDRVMINAYRWAQGSETYGAKAMHAYRQMLINHEVGHRLGHNHVTCRTPGALAPVMQQQTKSLKVDGITCRPNPWVFPGS